MGAQARVIPRPGLSVGEETGAVALIANYRDDLEQVPLPLNKIKSSTRLKFTAQGESRRVLAM